MALVIDDLASAIHQAISPKDKDGNLTPVSAEEKAYAKAIITTFKAGLTAHLPGTVVGVTTAGSPLQLGAATLGTVAGLVPATWSGVMQTAIPGVTAVTTEAAASTGYLMSASLVNFAPGNITGNATSTPVSPGPLVAGAGTGGTIAGLSGSAWAPLVMPPTGDPVLTKKIYDAISNYLISNAEIAYLTGSIAGICPTAAGPLALGAGVGGTIS